MSEHTNKNRIVVEPLQDEGWYAIRIYTEGEQHPFSFTSLKYPSPAIANAVASVKARKLHIDEVVFIDSSLPLAPIFGKTISFKT